MQTELFKQDKIDSLRLELVDLETKLDKAIAYRDWDSCVGIEEDMELVKGSLEELGVYP